MAQAYTPSLQISDSTRVTKIRELPLPGKALVDIGDQVRADTPVLAADLPGELVIVLIADRMGVEPEDVCQGLQIKIGEEISSGQLLCEAKTFFGFFTNTFKSPVSGIVEFFTEANAHLGIRRPSLPMTVNAYIDGVVTAIEEGKSVTVETDAAFLQGVFGVGGERRGKVVVVAVDPGAMVSAKHLEKHAAELSNSVLIGGSQFEPDALKEAAQHGVAAVVTGSIDSQNLYDFVGHKIGVSITGDERTPFSLIITEGFGRLSISKRVTEFAARFSGKMASVSGATQVRAGALRPEVIVSHAFASDLNRENIPAGINSMSTRQRIRIIRVPYFGEIGHITQLPQEPVLIPTGAKVRVLQVKLEHGEEVVVPRANVELV